MPFFAITSSRNNINYEKIGITLFRIGEIRAYNTSFDSYSRDEFNGTKILRIGRIWTNLDEVMSFDQLQKKIGSFF